MSDLIIIKATYYVPEVGPEKGTDVKDELSAEVIDGRLIYNGIYNRIFPDNFPGIVKKLKVEIEYKDKKYTKFYNEDDKINLPYDLGGNSNLDNHAVLNVTKSAKNNIFINSKINGNVKISGSDNKLINTFVGVIKKEYKKYPVVSWIAILGTIFTIGWSIFTYIYPNKDNSPLNFKTVKVESNSDLRNTLIEPIFDIVSKIYQLKTDYQKNDFINERKNRYFTGTGTIINFGKFSNGGIWASLRGNATDGNIANFECHFDDSWENTIKNIIDTEKTNVKFEGQVGYYTQGVLVAVNCRVVNIEN